MRRVLALAILCFAVQSAAAGVYFGAAGGESRFEQTISGYSFRNDATAWSVHAGFSMFKFFGLEAEYADLGKADDSVSGVRLESDVTSYALFAVGTLPLGPVDLYGKVGMARWNADGTISDGTLTASTNADGTDPAWSAGVAWRFAPLVSLRFEYGRIKPGGDTKIQLATVGIGVRF
jgi:hypothetical protein